MQLLIQQHYTNTRKLWGTHGTADKQAEAYKGLGKLYLTDERFVLNGRQHDTQFAQFLSEAMAYFADRELK